MTAKNSANTLNVEKCSAIAIKPKKFQLVINDCGRSSSPSAASLGKWVLWDAEYGLVPNCVNRTQVLSYFGVERYWGLS